MASSNNSNEKDNNGSDRLRDESEVSESELDSELSNIITDMQQRWNEFSSRENPIEEANPEPSNIDNELDEQERMRSEDAIVQAEPIDEKENVVPFEHGDSASNSPSEQKYPDANDVLDEMNALDDEASSPEYAITLRYHRELYGNISRNNLTSNLLTSREFIERLYRSNLGDIFWNDAYKFDEEFVGESGSFWRNAYGCPEKDDIIVQGESFRKVSKCGIHTFSARSIRPLWTDIASVANVGDVVVCENRALYRYVSQGVDDIFVFRYIGSAGEEQKYDEEKCR
jgi:hypothetical protein